VKEFALISLIRRVLSAKTKGAAMEIVGNVGDEYLPIIQEIVARITFKRTLDQNSLYYKWVSEIAKQTGETELEVRRYVKLIIGCKILVDDDEDFKAFCQMALKPLSYAKCLEAMDYVSVSSLMNTKQMNRYMEQIERHYRGQGYSLTQPKEAA